MALTVGLLTWSGGPTAAQSDEEAIKVVRSVIQADRQAVVAETLQLTRAESERFWPLYHQYRAELDKVADELVKLAREYAGSYPNVPDDRAKPMLKNLLDLERKHTATRASFLKKFGKILPPAKNLRFAQVEHRLDLVVRLKLASLIPLMPIEGRLTGEATGAAAFVPGAAGGAVVQTYELTATVAAIDHASRRLTLVSPDGIKETVKAGPEVINFDQIRVGDRLKVTATEELVVRLAGPGESVDDAGAAVVALAPKGAKPGGFLAETTRLTATVTAIDPQKRTATLRFENGSTKTVAVRPDVDLSRRKVGDQVVIRITETLAVRVDKP